MAADIWGPGEATTYHHTAPKDEGGSQPLTMSTRIMESQMQKNMEHKMDTTSFRDYAGVI